MTVSDYLVSLIRTAVPVLVGLLIAALAKAGLKLDEGTLSPLIDGLAVGGYYAVIRAAETRWPLAGYLLGWKSQPTYSKP